MNVKKAVILAGGYGTRITEESQMRPKPLIDIGDRPILWHLMKLYSFYGINEFIICCGYKGYLIKEYFANYFLHTSDVTINLATNEIEIHRVNAEPWKVTLIDTGLNTMTGGRIKRIEKYVSNEEAFCLTYGDGLSDIRIDKLIEFHSREKRLVTITTVKPPGRFGSVIKEGDLVREFVEKPDGDNSWINGGYFVLSPEAIDYIDGDSTSWELQPLEKLAAAKQLAAFEHTGFWMPMDTLRDKIHLENLWNTGKAPWALW